MITFFGLLFFLLMNMINSASGQTVSFGWCDNTTAETRDQNMRKKITALATGRSECFYEVQTANCYANDKKGTEYLFSKKKATDICTKYGGYVLAILLDDDAYQVLQKLNRTTALGLTKSSVNNSTWDSREWKVGHRQKQDVSDWTAHDLKPEEHAFTAVYLAPNNKLHYHSFKTGEQTPFRINVVCEERKYLAPVENGSAIHIDESHCEGSGGGGPGTGGSTPGTGGGGSGSTSIKIDSMKQTVVIIIIVKMILMIVNMI